MLKCVLSIIKKIRAHGVKKEKYGDEVLWGM